MRAVEMWSEFNGACAAMRPKHRGKLISFGIDAGDAELLAGITRARVHAGLWQPEPGGGVGIVIWDGKLHLGTAKNSEIAALRLTAGRTANSLGK
jgi:hypothetical protein